MRGRSNFKGALDVILYNCYLPVYYASAYSSHLNEPHTTPLHLKVTTFDHRATCPRVTLARKCTTLEVYYFSSSNAEYSQFSEGFDDTGKKDFVKTKRRIWRAVLGNAVDGTRDALENGVELLAGIPCFGVQQIMKVLLKIWKSFDHVDSNREECERILESCHTSLLYIQETIIDIDPDLVTEQLKPHVLNFILVFTKIDYLLQTQNSQFHEYIRREEFTHQMKICQEEMNRAHQDLRIALSAHNEERARTEILWVGDQHREDTRPVPDLGNGQCSSFEEVQEVLLVTEAPGVTEAVAVKSFEGEANSNEISFREGDSVIVLDQGTDWWIVQTADGMVGTAPAMFLCELRPSTI
ncbi:hypothetical protein BDN72DRAFT_960571 [Pluteus cervinus]|uniref:Uncharacterized protein n=1 Tax=Pluteus cervinus TaxID=181527 RepID=A0ACD3ARV2_9AGAR|nr:hypothetical protein BDN72DRAFT_960571 [Pluteus cervinus]